MPVRAGVERAPEKMLEECVFVYHEQVRRPPSNACESDCVFSASWAPLARCLPPQQPGGPQSARAHSGAGKSWRSWHLHSSFRHESHAISVVVLYNYTMPGAIKGEEISSVYHGTGTVFSISSTHISASWNLKSLR